MYKTYYINDLFTSVQVFIKIFKKLHYKLFVNIFASIYLLRYPPISKLPSLENDLLRKIKNLLSDIIEKNTALLLCL